MYAKVVALRKEGSRIQFKLKNDSGGPDMYPDAAVKTGRLAYGAHRVGEAYVKGLMLSSPTAAPGTGVLMSLFQPTLTFVQHYSLGFRGFELLPSGAVVMQEWRVYLSVQ